VAPGQETAPEPELPDADEAMALLVRRHGAVLFSYLLRLTRGDRQRAEDIYQETLIRAWQHPECYEKSEWQEKGGSSSRQWLITVARRVSIDQLRAAGRRPMATGDERHLAAVPDPVDQINRLLLAREVRSATATLSPSHREVLAEIYLEDRPLAEVAQRLGIPLEPLSRGPTTPCARCERCWLSEAWIVPSPKAPDPPVTMSAARAPMQEEHVNVTAIAIAIVEDSCMTRAGIEQVIGRRKDSCPSLWA
jgi:RNA polymerase sigma-70 factor, ECF subfamily